jgi:hypothetical protein
LKGSYTSGPDDFEKGIQTPDRVFYDRATIGYIFNDGDPVGEHRLVIFVNGVEYTPVKFEIQ